MMATGIRGQRLASLQRHAPATHLGLRAPCPVPHPPQTFATTIQPAAAGQGFGPAKKVAPKAVKVVEKTEPAPATQGAGLKGTATPAQLKDGLWNDCVPNANAFFEAAGKDVKAVTLGAGRNLVLYRHQGTVYCSDVNSTAYQFPMVDAKIFDTPQGPAVEVPLEGTTYDLRTGKVLQWCPSTDNTIRNMLASMKRSATPVDLSVFPTQVTAMGALRVRLPAE